mmetsp:Transcript_112216/g.317884  ORF Transcript_112216/g.317884 Transcript_112216/m.317884 type:complete len:230 (-) Transcript_112216:443-1132(-)
MKNGEHRTARPSIAAGGVSNAYSGSSGSELRQPSTVCRLLWPPASRHHAEARNSRPPKCCRTSRRCQLAGSPRSSAGGVKRHGFCWHTYCEKSSLGQVTWLTDERPHPTGLASPSRPGSLGVRSHPESAPRQPPASAPGPASGCAPPAEEGGACRHACSSAAVLDQRSLTPATPAGQRASRTSPRKCPCSAATWAGSRPKSSAAATAPPGAGELCSRRRSSLGSPHSAA